MIVINLLRIRPDQLNTRYPNWPPPPVSRSRLRNGRVGPAQAVSANDRFAVVRPSSAEIPGRPWVWKQPNCPVSFLGGGIAERFPRPLENVPQRPCSDGVHDGHKANFPACARHTSQWHARVKSAALPSSRDLSPARMNLYSPQIGSLPKRETQCCIRIYTNPCHNMCHNSYWMDYGSGHW